MSDAPPWLISFLQWAVAFCFGVGAGLGLACLYADVMRARGVLKVVSVALWLAAALGVVGAVYVAATNRPELGLGHLAVGLLGMGLAVAAIWVPVRRFIRGEELQDDLRLARLRWWE